MNVHEKSVISWQIDSLKRSIEALQEILDGAFEEIEICEIQKYTSGSGNETWKCFDGNGMIVCYIRQAHKQFWQDLGYWAILESMHYETYYGCSIKVHIVKEKDFNVITRVEHFQVLGRIEWSDNDGN